MQLINIFIYERGYPMKKNLIILLLSTAMVLTACGENKAQNVANSEASEIVNTAETDIGIQESEQSIETELQALESSIQSEIDNIANQYQSQSTTDSLNAVCKYFETLGLVTGEQTEMAGDMIGAISGVKYSDSKVELYEYDTASAKYKEIIDTGKTTVEGFNLEITVTAVNGPYVLYCEEATNKTQIVEEFSKMITE